ncbi:hypothetical protein PoB_002568500 [Plakobranchus ocellatus]|uniref:Uncharacterized protein n=1 Tax=Plakobranchus ocellatus TaxID=259542 RepID=A0AAV3ZVG1_9GAST|nr:hypothetical protein PoB_002568500 [Plakobranchus ocellatus]
MSQRHPQDKKKMSQRYPQDKTRTGQSQNKDKALIAESEHVTRNNVTEIPSRQDHGSLKPRIKLSQPNVTRNNVTEIPSRQDKTRPGQYQIKDKALIAERNKKQCQRSPQDKTVAVSKLKPRIKLS